MIRKDPPEPSQRAREVARDLFADVDTELTEKGLGNSPARFHLDGSDLVLSRDEAEKWVVESVDAGFPEIRFYLEAQTNGGVVVNLAAFRDPDSQYRE
jgi:hypothetical protein